MLLVLLVLNAMISDLHMELSSGCAGCAKGADSLLLGEVIVVGMFEISSNVMAYRMPYLLWPGHWLV